MSLPLLVITTLFTGAFEASFPSANAASLEENLRAVAGPQVRTVSRGRHLHLFTWASRASVLEGKDKVSPISANDNRVRSYLGFLRDVSYARGEGSGIAGPGIYAAIDPIASRSFGPSNDWVLVQFTMPESTRFLDLVVGPPLPVPAGISPNSARFFNPVGPFKGELLNQVKNFGCQNDGSNPPNRPVQKPDPANPFSFVPLDNCGCSATDLMGLWLNAQDQDCRAIRNRVSVILNLSAIEYSFSSEVFPTVCPARSSAAFVLFGDKAINWDAQVHFTEKLPRFNDGHDENRLIIQNLFALSRNPPPATPPPSPTPTSTSTPNFFSFDPDPWPSLRGQKAQTDMPSWIKQNLKDCGSFPEDAVFH